MSFFYDTYLNDIAEGNANRVQWLVDTVKIVMIDTADYTANRATQSNLSDVAAAARQGTPQTLTGKTVSGGGILDAADGQFPAFTGDPSEAVLIYKDTGTEATSRLVCYIDGAGVTLTPNGNAVDFVFDNGANKIGKI